MRLNTTKKTSFGKKKYGRHLRLYEAPPLRRQQDSDIGFPKLPPVQPMSIEIRQLSHGRASESMFLLLVIRRQNSCYSLSAALLEVNQRSAQCSLFASFEFPNESSYTWRRCRVYFLLISAPHKQLQRLWATEAEHHHRRFGSHDRRVGCRPNHSCRDAHCCWRHQQGPLHSTKPSATVRVRQHELLTEHSVTAGDELLGATKARGRRVYWWGMQSSVWVHQSVGWKVESAGDILGMYVCSSVK